MRTIVGGVGYRVHVPLSTYAGLPGVGRECRLRVVTVVREDEIRLFGFATAEEEELFPIMEANLGRLALIEELREEHSRFRAWVEELRRSMETASSAEVLQAFGALLHDHIRKEERVLFPIFEQRMPPEEARRAGEAIARRLVVLSPRDGG